MTVLADGSVDSLVALGGEIDMDNAPQVRQFLTGMLERDRPGRLLIDMQDVTFLGSAGVHALVYCQTDADRLGSRVELRRPRPQVREVLQICGVTEMFNLPG
ncbi:STAS domain-containing protein [Actinoplanes sp. NPDC049596]|uniref:STAS domain-containing protein n=1 Tax=unclassified Actinoplanes TaxID=2626549 RepID=UPI0034317C0E